MNTTKIISTIVALTMSVTAMGAMPFLASAANPMPVITSISPMMVSAGSSNITLNVYGSNFVPGSTIEFTEIALATTFVSSGQLQAVVPASYISTASDQLISVTNPAPGGGTSAYLTLNVTGFTPFLPNTGAGPVSTSATANLVMAGVLASLIAISFVTLRKTSLSWR